jgi:predicted nucleotidyltransferase
MDATVSAAMTTRHQANIDKMVTVALALSPILDRVVFIGGAVAGLLITDKVIGDVRVTKDVDIIIEVASFAGFAAIEEQLRTLGFRNDLSEGAPTCRYLIHDIPVDVLAPDGSQWGFETRWYAAAVRSATLHTLTAAEGES